MNVTIPREKIEWFPTIDYEACLHDKACLEFCHNEVFVWNAEVGRVEIANPCNCVIGCTSCAQICPAEAITFPDKDELKNTLRRLKAEVLAAQTAVGAA